MRVGSFTHRSATCQASASFNSNARSSLASELSAALPNAATRCASAVSVVKVSRSASASTGSGCIAMATMEDDKARRVDISSRRASGVVPARARLISAAMRCMEVSASAMTLLCRLCACAPVTVGRPTWSADTLPASAERGDDEHPVSSAQSIATQIFLFIVIALLPIGTARRCRAHRNRSPCGSICPCSHRASLSCCD